MGGVNDMFWGDRLGHFVDPFGHAWTVATHVADLTEQEMEKGAQAFYAQMAREEVGVAYRKTLKPQRAQRNAAKVAKEFLRDLCGFLCALCG